MSVASGTPALANTVRVDRGASTARKSPNRGALTASGYSTNGCAHASSSSGRQLVTMFLPKASPMFVAVADATVMRVTNVAVTVPVPAAGSGGCGRRQKQQHHQHQ